MLPILELKSGRERSLNNKHPWIFSGAVKKLLTIETGTIIKVVDNKKTPIAYGFYDKQSQIVCKIFLFSNQELLIEYFDEQFWFHKIQKAFMLRRELVLNENTNCCRLLHAEGDEMPGVIADIYNKAVVLQILHKGSEFILDHIVASLNKLGFEYIYIKSKESSKHIEYISVASGWINKALPQPIEVIENGCKFNVNVESGQKTGFFLDQRDNRLLVKTMSKGKTVLNAFSYTAGFSVYAAKGEAKHVVSVDISKDAIEAANINMQLNNVDHMHVSKAEDCFKYLKDMEDNYYDLIILDPPAFAKSAKMVNNAARGYKEINLMALKKIKEGGILFTYSCSKNIDRDLFRKIVFGAAADSGRTVQIIYQLTQPSDHPISIYHPEGEYLKGLVLKVT